MVVAFPGRPFGPFISSDGMEELRNHKYAGEDHSIIAKYILQPYWNYVINFLPTWLAPNLITLTGAIVVSLHFIGVLYFSPRLQGEAPWWLYISASLGVWIYQTMDALDGKQARRTGSSSPLGALFDHGIDSCVTVMTFTISTDALALFRLDDGLFLFKTMFLITVFGFFLAIWEEYHTHNLRLGIINGPVEGLLITESLYFCAGILGPQWFSQPREMLWNLSAAQVFIYTMMAVAAPTLLSNIGNVLRYMYRVRNKKRDDRHRPTLYNVFATLMPISIWCGCIWVLFEKLGDELVHFLAPFMVSMLFAASIICCRMILTNSTRDDMPLISSALFPLPLVILAIGSGVDIRASLSLYAVYGFCVFAHFAVTCCLTIAEGLGIKIFTIVPKGL